MDYDIETFDKTETDWRVAACSELLKSATEKRKANISVINLCKKLDTKRSIIYRMESGAIDVKVSTLLNYLHGFGYHLEIVEDNKEEIEDPKHDMIVETDGIQIPIEHYDSKEKLDKRTRLKLLKLILEQMESELEIEEGK